MRRRWLVVVMAQALCSGAYAQTAAPAHDLDAEHASELDAIVVKADPLGGTAAELPQPVSVIRGEELRRHQAVSLGQTLASQPGVEASYFGPSVGRPIIRGLDGPRVQILSDGVGSMDVSTVSVDHAVTIEPFLADQIEVLRGPATLLYGTGAIGGVVNVLDGRIPERVPEEINGRAQIGFDSASDLRLGMARIDAGSSGFALHADVFYRENDDYEIPGFAERDHEDKDGEEEEKEGTLENTAAEAKGGAVGASLIGDSGFIGLSISNYQNLYGIPGKEEEEEEEAGASLLTLAKGAGDKVKLDLDQTRIDLKAGVEAPFSGTESLNFRLGRNDYEHVELEGDEVGTAFDNQEVNARLDVVHQEIGGWRGAYGLTLLDRDFEAVGEEAFVPASQTRQFGLFLVEQKEFGDWRVELGGRYDSQSIELDDGSADSDHSGFSLSAAALRSLGEGLSLSINLDRAVRAPGAEELYSDGPHAATRSFEIGDADLDEEISNQIDIGLRFRGERFSGNVHAYYNRFNDFIYLADTDEIEDDLPVRVWTQDDARFTGIEAELIAHLGDGDYGHFDLRLMTDQVRARLSDGGDLPRIPQARFGTELKWHLGAWSANGGFTRYFEQDRVAEFEDSSDGFTLIHADVSYAFDLGTSSFELYLRGENLGDEEARLHTSVLKDVAPLPGRNLGVGLRAYF